jgi:VanZ family protein
MSKHFLIYWLPPVAWMVFIFPSNEVLTAESTSHLIVPLLRFLFPGAGPETIETLHIIVRKCTHFLNYAFLAFLLFRAFRSGNKEFRMQWIVFAGCAAVGYAALDEIVQVLISARSGSVYDWLIDSFGVVVALGVIKSRNGKR